MAAQFTDDAYNKRLVGGQGTLVGNWFEERVLRDASGEGRTIPQRHIPRRDLLVDWTKTPSTGPRKQDDTFERIYGPQAQVGHVPLSTVIGAGEEDVFGDRHVAEHLQAEGRVARRGPKAHDETALRFQMAEDEVQDEEAVIAAKAQERFFDTSTGIAHSKPDMSQTEKPKHLKKSYEKELLFGPTPDRDRAFGNEGLEVPTHSHYSNMEMPTHARMCFADPKLRNDLQATAARGVNTFGRHSEFSMPVGESCIGLAKDEELDTMYKGLSNTQPLRHLGGGEPGHAAFRDVPSLASLKQAAHRRIAEVWGAQGYVVLRQRLFDHSDAEGFVKLRDAMAVMRDELGLSREEVSEGSLTVYLKQLITMKKDEFHVGALMSSLRPALPLKVKRRVLNTFKALGPVDGSVRLGSWIEILTDPALRKTIAAAFGAIDENEFSVADMPLNEQVFLELLSDLAPLTDVETLLSC